MPYFPLFVDLKDQPCLILGGGMVALRKAEKLLPYGPKLTVLAPDFVPGFDGMPEVTRLRRHYVPGDEDGMTLVIAATDDAGLNHAISRACREKRIPVNVVDDKQVCSFLFPSLVQKGELSVGISTGGASPTAAIWMKEQVSELIPEEFDAILTWLESLRPRLKAEISEESVRAAWFAGLFRACLERGRPLTAEEMEEMLT